MPFLILIIGAVIAVVAFNNTQGDLVTALENDIPGFFKWGAAIAAILGLGYLPGMERPSRWLLAVVVLVIVLTQYQQIIAGFSNFAQGGASSTDTGAAAPAPTAAYATGNVQATPTAAQIAGSSGGGAVASTSSPPNTAAGGIIQGTPAQQTGQQVIAAPQGAYGMNSTLAAIGAIMGSPSIGFGGSH